MTTGSAIRHGIASAQQRRGLIVALYVIDLGIALLLAAPIFAVLQEVVSTSGFSPDLAKAFDEALWWEVFQEAGATFGAFVGQLLWTAVAHIFWKAVVRVGVVYAVHHTGPLAFMHGVARFGLLGIALTLLFIVPLVLGILAAGIVAVVLQNGLGGAVGVFWAWLVVFPTLVIALLVVLDLMQDYASIALIVREEGLWEAWRSGVAMPFGAWARQPSVRDMVWCRPYGIRATLSF